MKKTVSLLLALAMALALCTPTFAASPLPELTFDLSCDGATMHTLPRGGAENALENVDGGEVKVKTGDKITVKLTVSAEAETTAGVMQDEIYYDEDFFELVSFESAKNSSGQAEYVAANPTLTDGQRCLRFFNISASHTYDKTPKLVGSFTLKIKDDASGAGVVYSKNCEAYEDKQKQVPEHTYSIVTNKLWVGFGEWDGATVNVKLNPDGGALPDGVKSSYSVNTEKVTPFTLPTPTRQFHTFDYWSAGGKQYKDGTAFPPANLALTEDTTLTAHWTAVPAPAAPKNLDTVKASKPDASDGKITGVDATMEYRSSSESRFTPCVGTTINGLKAGTYYVCYSANEAKNTPAGQTATVQVEAWPLRDVPTGLSGVKTSLPDAADGKLIGTTTQMEYSLTPDDEASFKPCSDKETTGLKAGVYFVRYIFDTMNNKAPSEPAQVRVIDGSKPDAPMGLVGVKPSLLGKKDGKITGVKPTMEYSTDPDFTTATTCPDGEITGLVAGTYYIRLMEDKATNTPAGNYAAVKVPEGDAPAGGGGGGGTPPAGAASSDLTVQATVSEDSVATLSSVSDADIKAAAAATESGLVGIDLSRGKEPVEAAKLPSGMIGKIASAVNGNGKGGFALKLTSANLEFDMKALQSLASQAKSGELQINMRDTGTMALNDKQYDAISGMSVYGGYNVSAAVGKQNISQFNGGNIRISIPFNIPSGRYADGFSAYYVAPDGKLTRLATTYEGGMINFTVNHFSDYIIAYSEQNSFIDVVPGAYYEDAVAWAVKYGITTGTSADTFSPDAGTTRAQVVTFLWRAAGKPTVNYAMSFRDVPSDYYTEAVRWAVSKGITDGTSADTFSPDAVCTRAQIVTFLWRTMGKPAASGTINFRDVASDYYTEAVRWAVSKGITSGITPTTFSPDATCTRAQVVTFLYRSMK